MEHEDVRELARQGRKIDAIKLLRERTGLGLKESKDWVDALEFPPGSSGPIQPKSSSGGLGLLLLLAAAGVLVWMWISRH